MKFVEKYAYTQCRFSGRSTGLNACLAADLTFVRFIIIILYFSSIAAIRYVHFVSFVRSFVSCLMPHMREILHHQQKYARSRAHTHTHAADQRKYTRTKSTKKTKRRSKKISLALWVRREGERRKEMEIDREQD